MRRMDDPEEEWEYEEYYKESNFSWFLREGLSLGKKAVITGVILSSVPLVLPPLVVISALGFAVSVPAGVVLASYVCTEKIMNKLLPIPPALPYIILEEEDYDVGQFEVVGHEENVAISIPPYVDSFKDIGQNNHAEKVENLVEKNTGNAGEVAKKKRNYYCKKKMTKSCLKMSHGVGGNEEYKLVKRKKQMSKPFNVVTTAKVDNLVPTVEMKSFIPHITAKEGDESEKKLWDKVDALRLIVGYKGSRGESLNEELVGLYAFTGVKAPSSFEITIEDKIHFLMSIIGVK